MSYLYPYIFTLFLLKHLNFDHFFIKILLSLDFLVIYVTFPYFIALWLSLSSPLRPLPFIRLCLSLRQVGRIISLPCLSFCSSASVFLFALLSQRFCRYLRPLLSANLPSSAHNKRLGSSLLAYILCLPRLVSAPLCLYAYMCVCVLVFLLHGFTK